MTAAIKKNSMAFDLESTLYSLPGIVAGLTLHEYSHARASYKLGDETAKTEGRLTLNPLKHIDPLGMVLIICAGFGWAKPVSFNSAALSHPRRDRALIAFAGPCANLLLGVLSLVFVRVWIFVATALSSGGIVLPHALYRTVAYLALYSGIINVNLFVFNILPLPPLDGSHIFLSGLHLTPRTEALFLRWGTVALFAIIILENTLGITILPTHLFTNWVTRIILG